VWRSSASTLPHQPSCQLTGSINTAALHRVPMRTYNNPLVELEAGEHVVVDGVGEVVEQVLERSDAGDEALDEVPEDGEHGEPAVLDLLELELLERLVVLAEAERVEDGAAGVGGVAGAAEELLQAEEVLLAHGPGVVPVLEPAVLGEAHQRHLEDEERVRVGPVVVGARGRDHARPEPRQRRLRRDQPQLAENLRRDGARRAQHGEPAVDHLAVRQPLGLDEPAGALRIRQAQRVEPEVAGKPAARVIQPFNQRSIQRRLTATELRQIERTCTLLLTCHPGRRGTAWTRTTAACPRLAANQNTVTNNQLCRSAAVIN
jgi:hypothetical protein